MKALKKKKKWHAPKSTLRDRLEERKTRRDYSSFFAGEDADGRQFRWEKLPATLVKPMGDHMFQKTVAAVLVVICLGLFSLLNLPLTNRFVDAVHYLTVYQTSPAEVLNAAKPVMQSVREFSWRRTSVPPTPQPGGNDEDEMAAPVNGILASSFGPRLDAEGQQMEMHYGIDVASEAGSPVYAAFSGKVMLVQEHQPLGLTIYLEHPESLVTIYGRVAEPLVKSGDQVSRGQKIAVVATNSSSPSHLHFEIWLEGQPVNPEDFIKDTE